MNHSSEYNLSSQGPIYQEFMDKLNQEIDGQQQAKEKFTKEILKLNNSLDHEDNVLRTMILTGPEENQKIKLLQTTAKILFGHEECLIQYDCKKYPTINPFSFWRFVKDIEEQSIEEATEAIEEATASSEEDNNKEDIFIPQFAKETIESFRHAVNEDSSLHKLAQKHPWLSLIYFDNIDSLEKKAKEAFLDTLYNQKEIILDTSIYSIDFSKSIVIFGFKTKERPGMGFTTSTNHDIKGYIKTTLWKELLSQTDQIIEFQELEPTYVDMYIQRLRDTFQSKISHLSEDRISLNFSADLIEAFKKDHLSGIDLTTKNIEKKRERHMENEVASLIKNNKKFLMSNDNTTVNHLTLSIDSQNNGGLIWKIEKKKNEENESI